MTFTLPATQAVQLRPRNLRVLVRAEQPPREISVLWRPHHREQDASAFVVYGRVIRASGPTLEPVWSNGGELRARDAGVAVGDRVFWKHGFGPSVELVDGTHFFVHADGLLGTWQTPHECRWRWRRASATFACEGCGDERAVDGLETRLPSCGDRARGPRVGSLEPRWDAPDAWTRPSSNVRPFGRKVSVTPEDPPTRDAGIWTPHDGVCEGAPLGYVVYGRAVRVGAGGMEDALVTDPRTGKVVRERQRKGCPTIKRAVRTNKGWQTFTRAVSGKQVWVPSTTREGERIVWAQGWDDVTGHVHEDGIVATWTPEHACCVHVGATRDIFPFRCCSCGAGVAWPDARPDEPLVLEAVIGRDPTREAVVTGEPEPDPEDESAPTMVRVEDDA